MLSEYSQQVRKSDQVYALTMGDVSFSSGHRHREAHFRRGEKQSLDVKKGRRGG